MVMRAGGVFPAVPLSFRGNAKHRTRNVEIPGSRSRASRNDGAALRHALQKRLFGRVHSVRCADMHPDTV
jgi:hypothetical protein